MHTQRIQLDDPELAEKIHDIDTTIFDRFAYTPLPTTEEAGHKATGFCSPRSYLCPIETDPDAENTDFDGQVLVFGVRHREIRTPGRSAR